MPSNCPLFSELCGYLEGIGFDVDQFCRWAESTLNCSFPTVIQLCIANPSISAHFCPIWIDCVVNLIFAVVSKWDNAAAGTINGRYDCEEVHEKYSSCVYQCCQALSVFVNAERLSIRQIIILDIAQKFRQLPERFALNTSEIAWKPIQWAASAVLLS